MFEIERDGDYVCICAADMYKFFNADCQPNWQHLAQVWACNCGVYSAADEFRAFIGVAVGDFAYPLPAADFTQGEESPPILSDADLAKALESCYIRGRQHFFDRLRALIDSRE